jgi:hypothetical protein
LPDLIRLRRLRVQLFGQLEVQPGGKHECHRINRSKFVQHGCSPSTAPCGARRHDCSSGVIGALARSGKFGQNASQTGDTRVSVPLINATVRSPRRVRGNLEFACIEFPRTDLSLISPPISWSAPQRRGHARDTIDSSLQSECRPDNFLEQSDSAVLMLTRVRRVIPNERRTAS